MRVEIDQCGIDNESVMGESPEMELCQLYTNTPKQY